MTQQVLMSETERVACLLLLTVLLASTILAISLVALLKDRHLIPVIGLISPFIFQYVSMVVYIWKGPIKEETQ